MYKINIIDLKLKILMNSVYWLWNKSFGMGYYGKLLYIYNVEIYLKCFVFIVLLLLWFKKEFNCELFM